MSELETQFEQWRGYVGKRAVLQADAAELEDHLRASVDELVAAGLQPDEAFLIAVKRMGSLDDLSREFAQEHSERLWKQLVLPGGAAGTSAATVRGRGDLWAMLICALGAALSVKVPELFGWDIANDPVRWFPYLGLFTLPWLAALLVWRRRSGPGVIAVLVGLFAVGAVVASVYRLDEESQSLVLLVIHLPIALWLVVGLAYTGRDWRSSRRRMDFIRFTGECAIYYVLIAMGGGVLLAFLYGIFSSIGLDPDSVVTFWIVPGGAAAAVVVAGWLVEGKQNVIENIAPVLGRLFLPLFTVALLAFLVGFLVSRQGIDVDRDVLTLFDLLLVVVLGLLLYTLSARDPLAPLGIFDRLTLALVGSALLVDALVLVAVAGRISQWGPTPNRAMALGLNIVVLVNLLWAAWLAVGFARRRVSFEAVERWQTGYLPVYGLWALVVAAAFPPIFHYV